MPLGCKPLTRAHCSVPQASSWCMPARSGCQSISTLEKQGTTCEAKQGSPMGGIPGLVALPVPCVPHPPNSTSQQQRTQESTARSNLITSFACGESWAAPWSVPAAFPSPAHSRQSRFSQLPSAAPEIHTYFFPAGNATSLEQCFLHRRLALDVTNCIESSKPRRCPKGSETISKGSRVLTRIMREVSAARFPNFMSVICRQHSDCTGC